MSPDDALRERILEAAVLLIEEGGVDRFSLEGVAFAAGVDSEEMHRLYPTLNGLVLAIAERSYAAQKATILEAMGTDEEPGAYLRGYIESAFPTGADRPNFTKLMTSLLRSAPLDYEGLAVVRQRHIEEDADVTGDGLDPVHARIVRLAVDGLFLNDVFGLCALSEEERREILDRLHAMTKGTGQL